MRGGEIDQAAPRMLCLCGELLERALPLRGLDAKPAPQLAATDSWGDAAAQPL
ncbi:MAG: hypothetical protein HXY30_14995 [Pseudorhodoplanes sp.]|nr:hypothetical protein [Pseudorhodoplanes sp.]